MDIVLRDLERGLFDFPRSARGARCTSALEDGEEEIGYWHDIEEGYGGRQPL